MYRTEPKIKTEKQETEITTKTDRNILKRSGLVKNL